MEGRAGQEQEGEGGGRGTAKGEKGARDGSE